MAIQEAEFIWMNGKLTPWKDATVHVLSHSLHYGSGVFEGIRCYHTANGPAVFRLDEHLIRLFFSAKICQIKIPYTFAELKQATMDTLRKNKLDACYIRPLVYYGYSSMGVHPGDCPVDVSIAVWPWNAYLGEEGLSNGIKVTVSSWRKYHSSMMPALAKATGNYMNSVLAVQDAVANGYEEALLLNMNGTVAEGSGENLFMIKDGKMITPELSDTILNGITRDSAITIIKDLGYEVIERSITVPELFCADELFFTGTAAEVTPIGEIDGRIIGQGKMGPITKEIQSTFFEAVQGKSEKYADWLSFVNL